MSAKPTLALIEDLVAYRDRITDRADRDMLADVANELSTLNASLGWRPVKDMPVETHCLVWGPKIAWRGPNLGYRHADFNGHKGVVTLDGRCGHPSLGVTMWTPIPAPPAIARAEGQA